MAGTVCARLEPGCDLLAPVVTKSRENCPFDAGSVHASAGRIDELSKIAVHAADYITIEWQPNVLGSSGIFPGKIAGCITLLRQTTVCLEQVIVDQGTRAFHFRRGNRTSIAIERVELEHCHCR